SDRWIDLFPSIFLIRIFLSSISDKSAAIAYEVLDEWDDRVRTSASSVAFTDSSILDEQQNLYKALIEAYDADKAILDTYGQSTILKRRKEDDDQEGPSVGSDRGSKRLREGGEHASANTPSETATGSAGRSTTGSQSRQLSA
nr:hypothetical protein [Tanacetum cinerariifolium]